MTIYPKTIMLLGSGELGKEVTIAAKRIGCKVIACDKYPEAPAMQVADIAEVFEMSNEETLLRIIRQYKPDLVVPEIEALAVDALAKLEAEGIKVVPTARATKITMNRDEIRNLASKKLGIKTARFAYASNLDELKKAADPLGWPVFIKPIMSSSGKGQSLVHKKADLEEAWDIAMEGARGSSPRVIIEELINFELEITLLTIVQQNGKTIFCEPIGHEQSNGDYQCSWQPANLNQEQLEEARRIAKSITNNLGGAGLFGVEFFICKDKVIFSELSPRPHDTGLVTLTSQNLNEFELHLRAILGIPIPEIRTISPAATRVLLADKSYKNAAFTGIEESMKEIDTNLLIFGKKTAKKGRRMGITLAKGKTTLEARQKADFAASCIQIIEDKKN